LADWIASADNPLTARVQVNRIWQGHFGVGLVPTASDFGAMGEEPALAELLDWLAAEFVASGWSQKALHRLIVTSATYRQASRVRPEMAALDPDNALWWRFPMRRLSAEELRDAVLWSSGSLNAKRGGPGVFPPIDAGQPRPPRTPLPRHFMLPTYSTYRNALLLNSTWHTSPSASRSGSHFAPSLP
jgi:hypothetical protein